VFHTAREGLTHAGAACPFPVLKKLNAAMNYLYIGNWMKSRGFQVLRRVDTPNQVFEIAASAIRDREVLYLEFGVWRGESMRTWSGLLRNPGSRLHGFDSFEGLPESWDVGMGEKGKFSTNGAVPVIDDSRVTFIKGYFNETLPHYIPPPHEQLFVTLDADLYSSTRTVLSYLKPHISIGTYLYFDEFQSREHEPKAFGEFLDETGWTFRVVAASRGLSRMLFQRTTTLQ
jgi:hypothetical protein